MSLSPPLLISQDTKIIDVPNLQDLGPKGLDLRDVDLFKNFQPLGSRTHKLDRQIVLETNKQITQDIITDFIQGKDIIDLIKTCDLLKFIQTDKVLNQGGFGIITDVASPVYKDEQGHVYHLVMKQMIEPFNEETFDDKHDYIVEVLITAILTRAFNNNENPNFARLFGAFICKNKGYILLERYSGPLTKFNEIVGHDMSNVDINYMIIQILSALW